ncbi:MAG: GGDEF domain-containing protein, partial [Lachnospiraceae bacterium]|nr:GGDEF domain-containing protein [Lachnospiraceae bacterium]
MENVFRNHKIAVFANGWSGDFLELMLEGIRKQAAVFGVDVFVFVSYIFWGEPGPQSMSQLNVFHLPDPGDFDGAIMLTNTFNIPQEKERVCALFHDAGIPMITTEVPVENMAFVGTDNYGGMRKLADHLINDHNVKNIVYIAGIEGNEECAIRRRAVEDALEEHGLKLMDSFYGNFGYFRTAQELEAWLEKGMPLPDAFVCANDLMAIGAASTLYDHGIDVPGQVIVTGFDNIKEARIFHPLLATVSREWGQLGENAFITLFDQISHPDPSYSRMYDSKFIPSESCGCKPDPAAIKFRLDSVRNRYADSNKTEMLDIFFQEMRIPMAKVESKEQFYEAATQTLGVHDFIGSDFCICTEPLFFELDDESYPKRIRGYSKKMDLLYGRVGETPIPQRQFDSKEIYPGYKHVEGRSDLFIVAPLNNVDFIIGYVVVRNDPAALYDLRLRKYVSDINTLFITIRQYIFAQQTNRKLKEIYMTDFLTNMYNRTGCDKVLYSFIDEERKAGRETVLMFADINYMKLINDDYGHLNGDIAIKATAEALRAAMPDDWLFGRYGGDEFIAVGHCKDEAMAEVLKQKFTDILKNIVTVQRISFTLTASIGYTIIKPDDG